MLLFAGFKHRWPAGHACGPTCPLKSTAVTATAANPTAKQQPTNSAATADDVPTTTAAANLSAVSSLPTAPSGMKQVNSP